MNANIAAILYLVSGVLFILALRGLSSPTTSQAGNRNGMIGMAIAIGTTLWLLGPKLDALTIGLILGGVVVGGGMVGLSCAIALKDRGQDVVLCDPGEARARTSYGNAGVVSRGSIFPMASPALWGKLPAYLRNAFNIRLVQFDVESETPVRGPNGLCIECKPGEVGEAIGAIGTDARHFYTGYADKAASEKKVMRDVFKKGDAWFRSGDLMKMDKDGYIYFVDRIGDTFRFKGENVSTSEVGECCARAEGVDEAIVYGVPVPHYDGKAGMVALITGEGFSIDAFAQHVNSHLPVYARPRFVRLLQNAETTGTFKYKKMDLVLAGFDPAKVSDPLYVMKMDDSGYKPLTAECLSLIESGQYRM